MLAQNFKAPTDLGIRDDEFQSLVTVLRRFERQEVPAERLDMWSLAEPRCGTPACIAGFARYEQPGVFNRWENGRERTWPQGLQNLFWMSSDNETCAAISKNNPPSIEQAAIAIRNYLTHGDPRWEEAFAE
jgi:hypothetical protein